MWSVHDEKPNEADDINYIPRQDVAPENAASKPSPITLDEGQKAAGSSRLKAIQDPSPVEYPNGSRSRAYDLDAQLLKMR